MHTWRNGSQCVQTRNKKSNRTSIQHLECGEKTMNSKIWIVALALGVACGEKEEELVPLLTGTVSPDHPEYDLSGEFTVINLALVNDLKKRDLTINEEVEAE